MTALLLGTLAFGASVASADNDDNNRKKSSEIELERSQQEDRETQGQVIEINTLRNPPEMRMAVIDGIMVVRMLKTDEIARNAVRLGDYVTVTGEKISEVEFEAQSMRVDAHFGQKDKK